MTGLWRKSRPAAFLRRHLQYQRDGLRRWNAFVMCLCQAAARGGGGLRHQSWLPVPGPGITNTPGAPISGTLLQVRGEKNQREDAESHHREEVLQHLFVTRPEKRYDAVVCLGRARQKIGDINKRFLQKPKKGEPSVHPCTAIPALRRTRCPRTSWTS